jgi:hypothetical protein
MSRWTLLFGVGAVLTGWGCSSSERAVVAFSYVVKPSKALPAGMKTIAIEPAKVGPTTDEKWSDLGVQILQNLASDSRTRLSTDITLVDRRDPQVTFDEADLAAAGMSTAKGGSGGKLLAAQGKILSNINVKVETHAGRQRTISGLDLSGLWGDEVKGGGFGVETSEVETVSRTMTVQTDFRLLDAANNKVWDQYSATHTGTERTKASPFFGSSKTEAALTPQDKIIGTLVERAARGFISKLMPCRIDVTVEVRSSSNGKCIQGVKALRAEDYDQALALFKSALDAKSEDHRAAFGAGVACEATGQYDEALKFYQRAAAEEDDPSYIEARDRVKTYGSRVQ